MQIAAQLQTLERHWGGLRFGLVDVETRDGTHRFAAEVDFGSLDPALLRVELYAEAGAGQPVVRQPMIRSGIAVPGARAGRAVYVASVPALRPVSDFTARIVPAGEEFAVPLEAPQILWQR